MSNSSTEFDVLGFIKSNSLTYTEIINDLQAFIDALSEDEKLGFKTLFEGTNSQILIEMLAAKESDELYHVITSRSENLMYYLSRQDSAIAIAQNCSYSAFRGSNIKLSLTITPNETIILPKFSTVGLAEEYDLVITEELHLTAGESKTFEAYIGTVNEQTLTADTEDYLVFRFTNPNISEQIALYLNDKEVPYTSNILEMIDDKYFCITNAYLGVDAIYLNKRTDFTHRYTNGNKLTLKYIEYANISLNSIDVECSYGEITNVKQLTATQKAESVASIKTSAPLYAETQNRIVARDDFHKVFQQTNPEIIDAVGSDYSNAQVEVTYVKENGELLTDEEYEKAYDNLYRRRAYGIPMCLLSHPDVMLNLNIDVILQLNTGNSATIPTYVREVLSHYELQLGSTIDFSAIEHKLEDYAFVKTARVLPKVTAFSPNMLVPTGTILKPSKSNGKLYVVRNPLFLTGASAPSWNTTSGTTTIDGDIIWVSEEKSYAQQPEWSAKKSIRQENIVWVPSISALQFRCKGFTYKTGSIEPTWPTTKGLYVQDNQILWLAVDKNATAPTWTSSTIIEKGTVVNASVDKNVSYQAVNYVPKTSSSEPTWPTSGTLFTHEAIQYVVIDETYDPANASASNIKLNWNQYVKFNETVQVVS